MREVVAAWLASGADPLADPLAGMAAAGLLAPCADYRGIAAGKAALVEATGLLGVAGVWGGRQLVGRHFLAFGTAAQRDRWLGLGLAVAISEPKVGAHPKLLTARAEAVEGGWMLFGRKAWVSNALSADAVIVFAVVAEEAGRKRYGAFVVPAGTVGMRMEAMPGFHALRPSVHCLVTLDGCFVPADALLGELGTAYERMALPFRDIEDAVGLFAVLGALRRAVPEGAEPEAVGAVIGLLAVFEAAAERVVAALDEGRLRVAGDAVLAGLRVMALDIVERLKGMGAVGLEDLEQVLGIARAARMARLAQLAKVGQLAKAGPLAKVGRR